MGGEQRSIERGPQGSTGQIDVRRLQSACIFKPVDHNSLFVGNPDVIRPPKGIAGTITKRSSRLLSKNPHCTHWRGRKGSECYRLFATVIIPAQRSEEMDYFRIAGDSGGVCLYQLRISVSSELDTRKGKARLKLLKR